MGRRVVARGRRADAEQNVERIVAAARECLTADPRASVSDIARAAGVARVTLYGHFPNRADVVRAAVEDVLAAAERALERLDLSGDPERAVERLVASSWSLVAQSTAVLAAAEGVIAPEVMRRLHDGLADRLRSLIEQGRREGVFVEHLPVQWLVSATHFLIHGGALEVRAGRLGRGEASAVVTASVMALLTVGISGEGTGGSGA